MYVELSIYIRHPVRRWRGVRPHSTLTTVTEMLFRRSAMYVEVCRVTYLRYFSTHFPPQIQHHNNQHHTTTYNNHDCRSSSPIASAAKIESPTDVDAAVAAGVLISASAPHTLEGAVDNVQWLSWRMLVEKWTIQDINRRINSHG